MLNQSDVTKEIVSILKNDPDVAAIGATIDRGAYINVDPRKIWIGVYKGATDYAPSTLGRSAKTFNTNIKPRVIAQAVSFKSGEDCEDILDERVKYILDALWSTKNLNNVVDIIKGFSVEYSYNETERETVYFQNAVITIDAEARNG